MESIPRLHTVPPSKQSLSIISGGHTRHMLSTRSVLKKVPQYGASTGRPTTQRDYSQLFFRTFIQTKDLVFSTLGFLSRYCVVFCFLPTLFTVVSKKTKCLGFPHFFAWFLSSFRYPSKSLIFFSNGYI